MKILFFGSGKFGIPCLNALAESGHRIVGVFTQPARPAGRNKHLTPTDVALWADQRLMPYIEAENINAESTVEKIAQLQAELLLVIAFGQKISSRIINMHPKGAINVHASLLPQYRGAAPINRAIMDGRSHSGISIITLADKMDAGFILARAAMPIELEDDAQMLHDKLAALAPAVLLETIAKITTGTIVYTSQDESGVTVAHKLRKNDGFIDWSQPAKAITNKVRGLWPWPGAQAVFVSAKTKKCYPVTIAKAEAVEPESNLGTWGLLDENLNVICGAGKLKILRIRPAGSGLMDFRDFVNGRAAAPGDLFMPTERTF